MKLRRILVAVGTCIFATVSYLIVSNLYIKELLNDKMKATKGNVEAYVYLVESSSQSIIDQSLRISRIITAEDGSFDDFETEANYTLGIVERRTSAKIESISVGKLDGQSCVFSKSFVANNGISLLGKDLFNLEDKISQITLNDFANTPVMISLPFVDSREVKVIDIITSIRFQDANNEDYVWGFINMRINFSSFIYADTIEDETKGKFKLQLFYEENNEPVTIFGFEDVIEKKHIEVDADLYNLNLKVAARPEKTWVPMRTYVFVLVADIALVTLTVLFFTYLEITISLKQKFRSMAYTDSLTGVYTRRYLTAKIINPDTHDWIDNKNCYSIALVDIDSLKEINDKHGHEIGDLVIAAVTKCFENGTRKKNGDAIIRFGGDEFIVLFNNYTKQQLNWTLTNILRDIRNIKIEKCKQLGLTVSVGCAYNDKERNYSYNTLFKKADNLAYVVKESGRNDYRIE